MRKTIAAIVVTGVYLLTNLLSGEAAGPVETYQSWSDEPWNSTFLPVD